MKAKSREIIAAALDQLSHEGTPFDDVAGHWEPQNGEDKLMISMRDLTRFIEAILDQLD